MRWTRDIMMLMQEEQENPGGSADPQILPGSLEVQFRLQVKVMEGNDIVTLVIFDKEASTLLQTTCADLVESSTKVCTPPTLQYSFDHSAFVNTTLSSADARSRRKIIISKKKSSNQPTSVTTTRPFLYNKWTPVNIMTYVGEIIQSLESSRVFPDMNLDNSNFAYDSGDNSNSAYDSGNSSTDNSNSDEESNDQDDVNSTINDSDIDSSSIVVRDQYFQTPEKTEVKSRKGLKLLILDDEGNLSNTTKNVVYQEVFDI
ncbi:hypothetical protein OROGR_012023 [Orobanche gracilis]